MIIYEVGEIVKTKNKEGKTVLPAVVTKSYDGGAVEVLFADGTYGYRGNKKVTRTGKSIDMQSILDSIK
ncbi:MAG: hypothetical protein K2N73_10185 [Lachnospiraceae bacterium]|nr:hypothetical protein [Lachnospiraceae bacterium]